MSREYRDIQRAHHRHADRLDGIFYGLVFIWGALVLAGHLAGLDAQYAWWTSGWRVFFTGVGALEILGTGVRLTMPKYRARVGQGFVIGCILLGVGLGDRAAWIWPVLLGAIGLTILRGVFLQRKYVP